MPDAPLCPLPDGQDHRKVRVVASTILCVGTTNTDGEVAFSDANGRTDAQLGASAWLCCRHIR